MASLFLSIAIPLLSGLISLMLSLKGVGNWYKLIKKPQYAPLECVFPILWIPMYILMGYVYYNIQHYPSTENSVYLAYGTVAVYWIQFILNVAWSPIFFIKQNIRMAFVVLCAMTGSLSVSIVLIYQFNRFYSIILAPNLVMSSLALLLNFKIYKLNKDAEQQPLLEE